MTRGSHAKPEGENVGCEARGRKGPEVGTVKWVQESEERGSKSRVTEGGQRAEPGAGQLHGACEPSGTSGFIHCVVGSFWKVLSKGKDNVIEVFKRIAVATGRITVCRVTTMKAGRPVGGCRSHPGEEQRWFGPVMEQPVSVGRRLHSGGTLEV